MIRYLRGTVQILLTGAAPLQALNRFSTVGIAFWKAEPIDALHLRCRIYRKDLPEAERAALRTLCTLEVERSFGLWAKVYGLKKRPVLLVGVLAAIVLALLAQSRVWVIRIEGNAELREAELLHALAEEGVFFGSDANAINSQLLRHRMLLRFPELGWLAANRCGGVLTVLVTAREASPVHVDWEGAANVVAARPGIVTSVSALNGTAAVVPGDAVGTGELLISGITSWENRTQITHAAGEVYALTDRQSTLLTPDTYLEKQAVRRCEKEIFLIVGRKRIKIFGNSRISDAECDKMVNRTVWTLPGDVSLPVVIETVEYRYYDTQPVEMAEEEAEALLTACAERTANRAMIAGRILGTNCSLRRERGVYVLEAELSCEEMISVTVPIGNILEDDTLGETDQRGADRTDH